MALKVIGSGLGRTGTMSLKLALEQLGFSKCYHMVEVFLNQHHGQLWVDAADGHPDWDRLFEGYAATVDYPGARFWRPLAEFYPQAKVLHSVRDPDKWFDSTQATIFSERNLGRVTNIPGLQTFFDKAVHSGFADKIHDRDFMVAYFKRHTDDVIRTIPKERLLVYETGSGWEPLCAFLGVPVPESPFPRENTREKFAARVADAPQDSDQFRQRLRQELDRAK
jgi:Sulfotransferase domain